MTQFVGWAKKRSQCLLDFPSWRFRGYPVKCLIQQFLFGKFQAFPEVSGNSEKLCHQLDCKTAQGRAIVERKHQAAVLLCCDKAGRSVARPPCHKNSSERFPGQQASLFLELFPVIQFLQAQGPNLRGDIWFLCFDPRLGATCGEALQKMISKSSEVQINTGGPIRDLVLQLGPT